MQVFGTIFALNTLKAELFWSWQQFCLSVCNSSPTMHHSHLNFYVHYSPEFTGASYCLGLPAHNLCCCFMSQIEYLTWTFFPSCDGQRSKLNQSAPLSRPHSYICLLVSIILQIQISEIWGQLGWSKKAFPSILPFLPALWFFLQTTLSSHCFVGTWRKSSYLHIGAESFKFCFSELYIIV